MGIFAAGQDNKRKIIYNGSQGFVIKGKEI
jgi:hypothetical protein